MIRREKFIPRALNRLVPDAKFAIHGEGIEHLHWLDERPQPSTQQINAELDIIVSEIPMEMLRDVRARLLAQSDWLAVSDRSISDEERAYRQALRDLPTNNPNVQLDANGELTNVNWPTPPVTLGSVSFDLQ